MFTAEEIRSQTFEKSMRGYRPEDVHAFLSQVAATMDELSEQKADTERKLAVLAQKVEEYRGQEESLKSALLNAQRMGDNMIHEAKQKGDAILNEAMTKAKKMMDLAQERERDEKEGLQKLEDEISGFKANILGLYQQHIESLTEIDRQVNAVHTSVFGEEREPEDAKPDSASEETVSPIEHAGSIVDSFQSEDAE